MRIMNGNRQEQGRNAFVAMMAAAALSLAQQPAPGAAAGATPPPTQSAAAAADSLRPSYVLGPNDQIIVRVARVEDFDATPIRVDENGQISLPLVGKIPASGLSVEQLEQDIARRLTQFVVNPQVSIAIAQFRTEPVFLVGAFQRPGIHALSGRRTLLDTLATVGGLQPQASRKVKLTRRLAQGKIPLPGAVERQVDQISTVEINLNRLMETVNPEEDIVLQPFDVITASRQAQVYVNGEVMRPGPFDLMEGEPATVIRIITLAGGLTPTAESKSIRLLRPVLGTQRRAEIKLNLNDILAGRINDFPVLPDDVVYVPKSRSIGAATGRLMTTMAPALGTALLITLLR